MSCPSLSAEIWQHILQFASQADRARASLVCKAMQSAAVAAMEAVVVPRCDYNSLQAWLQHHGQHVTSFVMKEAVDGCPTLAQLPCPHLRELELELTSVEVLLAASSHGPGLLQSCAELTKVFLDVCHANDGLVNLSVLTALKDLALSCPQAFPGTVLQHCRHITRLCLGFFSAEDLHHISCLVDLQDLHLDQEALRHVTRSTLPGGLPTSLQVLSLKPSVLDPAMLSGLKNLQKLALACAGARFELDGGEAGAALLLTAIAGLQQLKDLELVRITCEWPPPSAAYSALTASSNLTRLELNLCHLPQAAQELLFSPGRALQVFGFLEGCIDMSLFWGQAGMQQLVSCCPELRSLRLNLQSGVDLAVLQELTALTGLQAEDVDEWHKAIQACAAMTVLKSLYVVFTQTLEVSTLLPLTALRQLTCLGCDWVDDGGSHCSVLGEDYDFFDVTSPPDVWLQLLELCVEDPYCQRTILHTCVQQLAEQQAQIAGLQAQHQQLAKLPAQLQQQASQLVLARSSASAAQDDAATARAEAAAARAEAAAAQDDAATARAEAATARTQAAAAQAQASAVRTQAAAAQAQASAASAAAAELRVQLQVVQGQVQQLLQHGAQGYER